MKKPRKTSPDHPTRIHQLAAEKGWSYREVAKRISALAAERGNISRAKVHGISIHRLATGKTRLTSEWMDLFAGVFGVPLAEIIDPPPPKAVLRVPVTMTFESGAFRETNAIPDAEQYDCIVEVMGDAMGHRFYAGEVRGDGANLRWPDGTSLILSHLEQVPGEIEEGKRYHVRRKADGLTEDSVRLLVKRDDAFWLLAESDQKEHQAVRHPSPNVEIMGRVRWSLASE